jgi:hypothetical protein
MEFIDIQPIDCLRGLPRKEQAKKIRSKIFNERKEMRNKTRATLAKLMRA